MKHRLLWLVAVILARCFSLRDLQKLAIYMVEWRKEIEADRLQGF